MYTYSNLSKTNMLQDLGPLGTLWQDTTRKENFEKHQIHNILCQAKVRKSICHEIDLHCIGIHLHVNTSASFSPRSHMEKAFLTITRWHDFR